jgi:tetrahydromethanopterin S-methyltransferase subunit G
MNYHTNKRFEEINKRIDETNKRIEDTNKRIEDMQRQIDRLYKLFIFSTSFITAVILILRFLFPA